MEKLRGVHDFGTFGVVQNGLQGFSAPRLFRPPTRLVLHPVFEATSNPADAPSQIPPLRSPGFQFSQTASDCFAASFSKTRENRLLLELEVVLFWPCRRRSAPGGRAVFPAPASTLVQPFACQQLLQERIESELAIQTASAAASGSRHLQTQKGQAPAAHLSLWRQFLLIITDLPVAGGLAIPLIRHFPACSSALSTLQISE